MLTANPVAALLLAHQLKVIAQAWQLPPGVHGDSYPPDHNQRNGGGHSEPHCLAVPRVTTHDASPFDEQR